MLRCTGSGRGLAAVTTACGLALGFCGAASGQAPATIDGPAAVTLGEPAFLRAVVPAGVTRHEWDLDGDGTFERDTGTRPSIEAPLRLPGRAHVAVRATLADGSLLQAHRVIEVRKPPIVGLEVSNHTPRVGEQVRFRVAGRLPAGVRFVLFKWRFAGLAPRTTKATRRVAAPRGAPGLVAAARTTQTIVATGAEPTVTPKLVRSFAKAGVYPVEVSAVDSAGGTTTMRTTVTVDGGGDQPKSKPPGQAFDCNGGDGGTIRPESATAILATLHCPVISFTDEPAGVGLPVTLMYAAQSRVCWPANFTASSVKRVKLARYQSKLDLIDPAPDAFGPGAASGSTPLAGAAQVGKRDECDTASGSPVSVDWGDGTQPRSLCARCQQPVVTTHVYSKPGNYRVTVIGTVPYLKGVPGSPKAFGSYLTKTTVQLEVRPTRCYGDSLRLRGIPVRSSASREDGDNCFIVRETGPRGVPTLIQVPTSATLGFGGLVGNGGTLVDVPANRLVRYDGQLTLTHPGHPGLKGAPLTVYTGPQYDVPVPRGVQLEEGGKERDVIAFETVKAAGQQLSGLPVRTLQAYVAPNCEKPYLRAWVATPKPIGGETPQTLLGGCDAGAAHQIPEPAADFRIDLSGLDLGFFRLENPSFIAHRRDGGGWFGGLVIRVPALGNALLNGSYQPKGAVEPQGRCPRTGDHHPFDGPTGFAVSETGDFDFAGVGMQAPLSLGFGTLDCIFASGERDPFKVQGQVGISIPNPSNQVFRLDGCVLLAILVDGQKADGCEGSASAAANQRLTWLRATAALRLTRGVDLQLAAGYVDVQKAANLFRVVAGGHVGEDDLFGLGIRLMGFVTGTFYFDPSFMFDVYGGVSACLPPIPLLGRACANAEAVVSTNGIGACAVIGGFAYYWKGGLDLFLGCDMSDSDLRVSAAQAGPARSIRRTVPAGLSSVGFHVRGAQAPGQRPATPRVIITGPGGTRIVDQGRPTEGQRGVYALSRTGRDVMVRIFKPQAGEWTIESAPGAVDLQGVGLSTPLPEPQIEAQVRPRGGSDPRLRELVFEVKRLAETDRVQFVERGRTVARALSGVRSRKEGRIPFSSGNASIGRRDVYAVVYRRGLPYRRMRVAQYQAPKPPPVAPPTQVLAAFEGSRLQARWKASPGAESHEVTASFDDGRVLRYRLGGSATSLAVPVTSHAVAVTVRVVAIAADERRSAVDAARQPGRRDGGTALQIGL